MNTLKTTEGTASTQLENEISDRAVEDCWEHAEVKYIFHNTKSGKYAYSDEAEQLSTIEYDTAADAITALNAYVPYCADHQVNQTHPIEVGNWGIPTAPAILNCNCLHGVCVGVTGVVCKMAADFHDKERTGGEG